MSHAKKPSMASSVASSGYATAQAHGSVDGHASTPMSEIHRGGDGVGAASMPPSAAAAMNQHRRNNSAAAPSLYKDKVRLDLLLITGQRVTLAFAESTSIATVKQELWREWPQDWPSRPHSPASIRLLHLGHILSEESVLGVAPPGQTVPPLSTPGTPEATGKSGASSGSALRKRFQNRSASTNSTSANNASGQGPLPTAPSYRNLRPGTSPTVMHVLVKPEDSQSPSAAAAADTKTSPAKGSGLRGRKGAKEEERKEEGGGESSSSAVAGGETGGATAGNTTPGATNAAAATAAAAGAAPGAAGVNEGGAASRGGAIEASNSRRQQSDADGSGGCCASCVIA